MSNFLLYLALPGSPALLVYQIGESLLSMLHVLGHDGKLRLKPKSHVLAHVVLVELRRRPALNPWVGCTFRDEDMIGKLTRIVKAVHARVSGVRAIQFYCAKLNILLRT